MSNFWQVSVLVIAMAFAGNATAGLFGGNQSCVDDSCNTTNNSGDKYGNHAGPVTGNTGITNAHSSDDNINNLNNAYGGQGGQGGAGGQGGQGGTGLGVGLGYGQGGDAYSGAVSGSQSGVLGSGNSRSSSGVYGSGNSASGAVASGGDVSRSGNSRNANTNLVGSYSQGGQGGDATGVDVGGFGNEVLSPTSNAYQGQGQGQQQGQQQGILASGNSLNHVNAGDASARQGQVGINSSENVNRNRSGDVTGTMTGTNTVGDTTSNVAVGDTSLVNEGVTVGDTSLANTVDGNNSSNSIGDVNVTVEGMSDEAARALGQPDQVTTDVDARDLSTENQNIDASTTINDNSVIQGPRMSAAAAAPTFSSICTSGAAGQSRSYGISLSVTNDVCQNLMMADAWMALGEREKAIEFVKIAGKHAKARGLVGYLRHIVTLGIL